MKASPPGDQGSSCPAPLPPFDGRPIKGVGCGTAHVPVVPTRRLKPVSYNRPVHVAVIDLDAARTDAFDDLPTRSHLSGHND